MRFASRNSNWEKFGSSFDKYMSVFAPGMAAGELNQCCWTAFENISGRALLKKATKWSKKSIELEADPMYMDTYANLLYKTGNKDEAIKIQKEAIGKLSADEAKAYQETLAKMEKDEKTWK